MPQRLTTAQINNVCRRCANLSHTWPAEYPTPDLILDYYLIDLFENLYNTGLRFYELFTLTRWGELPDNQFRCSTLKNSNPRIFKEPELTPYFVQSIRNDSNPYDMCRYNTTVRWFKEVTQPLQISLEDYGLSTHIFRHNKVKQLRESGWTTQQVSDYLGEVDDNNTEGYNRSLIFG
jgi:integrase